MIALRNVRFTYGRAGDPFEHSLLKRPTQRFDRLL